jgi:hypothetical protein
VILCLIGIVLTRILLQILGYLRAWSTRPRQMFPYMRSLTQVSTLFNPLSQHIHKLSPVGILQRCSSFEQIFPDMDRRALFLRNSQPVVRYLCSSRQREVARFCPTTFFRAWNSDTQGMCSSSYENIDTEVLGTGRSWTYQRPLSESTPTPKVIHEITAGLAFAIRLAPEHYVTPYSSCEPDSYILRNAAYYSYLYCRLIVPLMLFHAFRTLRYYGDSPSFAR